jgi:hypothetical protein
MPENSLFIISQIDYISLLLYGLFNSLTYGYVAFTEESIQKCEVSNETLLVTTIKLESSE